MRKSKNKGAHPPKFRRMLCVILAAAMVMTTGLDALAADTAADAQTVTGEVPESAEDTALGVDLDEVSVKDAETDPVLETYIEENADEEYTDTDDKKLVNFIAVKQTFFDKSLVEDTDTIDSIMTEIEEGDEETADAATDKYVMQTAGYTAVYELDEDSDYYVAFLDTMSESSASETREAVFAVNNNDGEAVDGCIYDAETGIAYIPKDLLLNDAGEQVLLYLQVQLMQLMDLGQTTKEITVTIDDGKDILSSGTVETDLYDTETALTTEAGLTIESLSVDGTPVDEDLYSYDSEAGELVVAQSPTSTQSVSITVSGSEGILDKLLSYVSDPFTEEAHADTVSYAAMSYFARNIDIGSMSVGDYIQGTVAYRYSSSYQHTSTIYGAYLLDKYIADLISAIDNNYSIDTSTIGTLANSKQTNAAVWLSGGTGSSSIALLQPNGLGSISSQMVLQCAHVDTSLDKHSNGADGEIMTDVVAKIRLLATGTDASGTKYAIFGIIVQMTHTQSGVGIFKVSLKTKGKAYVQKASSNSSSTSGNSNYSLAGAKYAVYKGSSASGTVVATLTTDSTGKSNTVELDAGTYTVKETTASKGFDLDTKSYTVTVTAGNTTVIKSTEPMKTGSLTIYKYSKDSSTTSGNSNYSLKGAVFGIYTNSTCSGTAYKTITLGDQNGSSSSGTVDGLPYGTYYVKEITPPTGYLLSTPTIQSVTVNSSTAAVKVGYYNPPIMVTVKLVKEADFSDVAMDALTATSDKNTELKLHEDYSLEGAVFGVYPSEEDAEAMTGLLTTITTDENGEGTASNTLALGTYYVREITAPEGYELSDEVYEVKAYGNAVSATNTTVEVTVSDPPQTGKVSVYKYSDDNSLLEDYPSYYFLEGAQYTVYYSSSCSTVSIAGVITTDADGYGELDGILYGRTDEDGYVYIKETRVPTNSNGVAAKFELDKTVYKVKITSDSPSAVVESTDGTIKRTLYVYKGPMAMLETGTDFTNDIPDGVTCVQFTSGRTIPSTAIDVSWAQNGSIMAWKSGNYWYVQSASGGTIYFNFDSSYMFSEASGYGGHSLKYVIFGSGIIDTSYTTDMSCMFSYCEDLTTISGLTGFDTSNVTTMDSMFEYCESLTKVDVSGFDTGNVKNFRAMFYGCHALGTITGIGGLKTANATNIRYMFNGCYLISSLDLHKNGDVWNTSKVTQMNTTFANMTSLKSLNLTGWDTSKVTTMAAMFYNDKVLTTIQGLNSFDTGNVENVTSMFGNCLVLNDASMTLSNKNCYYNTETSDSLVTVHMLQATSRDSGNFTLYYTTATASLVQTIVNSAPDTNGVSYAASTASLGTTSVLAASASVAKTPVRSAFRSVFSGIRSAAAVVSGGGVKALLSKVPEKLGVLTEALAAGTTTYPNITNAVYSAYTDKNFTNKYGDFEYAYMETDANTGEQTAVYALYDVPYGLTLYVKETVPGSGLGLDESTWTFAGDADGKSVNSTDPFVPGTYGYISLGKTLNIDSGINISGNSAYSMEGITYYVYTNSACTTKLTVNGSEAKFVLNEYGQAEAVGPITLTSGSYKVYYVKEDAGTVPAGVVADTAVHTVTLQGGTYRSNKSLSVSDDVVLGSISVKKESSTAITTDGYSSLEAKFTVYTDSACTERYAVITTDTDSGEGTLDDLPVGTYYIKETEAPPGFEVSDDVFRAVITANASKTAAVTSYSKKNTSGGYDSVSGAKITAEDDKEYGTLNILKTSGNSSVTDKNDNYSLEGAVFGVYTSETYAKADTVSSDGTGTTGIAYLTTDEEGKASLENLDLGTYYVKETKAPGGFEIDTTGGPNSDGIYPAYLKDSSSDGDISYTVTVEDEPVTVTVTIEKSSADTDATDSNSAYSLEGAAFGIYSGYTDGELTNPVATILTDEDGVAESGGLAIGTYYIVEEQAPTGFLLDETVYKVVVSRDGEVTYTVADSGENVDTIQLTADGDLSVAEDVQYAKLRIYKESDFSDLTDGVGIYYDEDTDTYTSDGLDTYTIAGAVYGVYASEDKAKSDTVDSSGQGTAGLGYLTTDEDGYTEYLEGLAYGTYYVKETLAPEGYEMDTNLYKVEVTSETESAVNSDGDEVTIINETEDSSTGEVAVTLSLSDSPAYSGLVIDITKAALPEEMAEIATLEGAQFTIRYYDGYYTEDDLADEEFASAPTRAWVINVIYEDGKYTAKLDAEHLQADISDELYYDSYTSTETEDEDGNVTETLTPDGNVILPLGTYTIEETLSPMNYTLEGSWYDTNTGEEIVDENGDAVSIVLLTVTQEGNGSTTSLSLSNELTKEDTAFGSATIIKKDSEGNLLEGVEFTLYMYSEETDSWYSVEVGTTDSDGSYVFENLPFGTYQIRETATLDGLTLLAEPIEFTIPFQMTVEAVEALGDDVDLSGAFLVENDTMYDFLYLTYTVTDNAEFMLPTTGVNPAIPVTLAAGLGIMAIGLFLAFRRKRAVR
ncbi:MAG: BspA family leucine-rich repeat surface protein [Clostridiales bacterium]|nr:BspA family leucine-rich repeat surface protein [Clostridiales bacterium]